MPLNKQPAVFDANANLPIGDYLAKKVVSIPMHAYMRQNDFNYIIETILS